MTIPKIDPLAPVSSSSPSTHFLRVGVLTIEGREYTVSVESPDPLIRSPHTADTLQRIRDLLDLHLNHLKQDGVDLSTIVVQQLDEKGLSYVNEDLEQLNVPSSEIKFTPYSSCLNPFKEDAYPISLRNPSFSNVTDAYRLLIDSLTKKPESENEEEGTKSINTNPFKGKTIFEPGIEQTKPKQFVESSDESSDIEEEDEISESEDENVSLIFGKPKDLSQYNQSGIINSIKFQAASIFSRIRDFLPTLWHQTDAIDVEKVIAEQESRFRSELSSSEQATLAKFATIRFDYIQ